MTSGSTTSAWSLKLIFGGFVVLMSTLFGAEYELKTPRGSGRTRWHVPILEVAILHDFGTTIN